MALSSGLMASSHLPDLSLVLSLYFFTVPTFFFLVSCDFFLLLSLILSLFFSQINSGLSLSRYS